MDDFTEDLKNELKNDLKRPWTTKRITIIILQYLGCVAILTGLIAFSIITYFRTGGDIQAFIINLATVLPLIIPILIGLIILIIANKINKS